MKTLRELKQDSHDAFVRWQVAVDKGESDQVTGSLRVDYETAEKAYFDELYEVEEKAQELKEAVTTREVGRHDVPREVWDLFDAAIATNLADAVSIYSLGTKYGPDVEYAISDLTEWAHASRHVRHKQWAIHEVENRLVVRKDGSLTQNSVICKLADRALAALREDKDLTE